MQNVIECHFELHSLFYVLVFYYNKQHFKIKKALQKHGKRDNNKERKTFLRI